MSEDKNIGTIGWIDLTVKDASSIRDFYAKVVGWSHEAVSMGDYDDFCMMPPSSDNPISGICYARGANKKIPPVWIMYITVADLDKSAAQVIKLGGEIIIEPREYGSQGIYCIIKDPVGAVSALYQSLE